MNTPNKNNLIIYAVAVIGIVARMAVAHLGYNTDIEAFWMTANVASSGSNVYAAVVNYNYGPIWFNILRFFESLSANNIQNFHKLIAALLTAADLVIFIILIRKASVTAACLFFLNPISIIITGFHSQFDNLAIMVAMFAVLCFGDVTENKFTKKQIGSLVLLGLSLSTKHIFFLFPLWLAIKQKGLLNKSIVIFIPILVFILLLLPYYSEGKEGIINNVILYKSINYEIFYRLFVPAIIQFCISATFFWWLMLICSAFYFKKHNNFEALLLYTIILVTTSPAMASQYLAIVIPYIAIHSNKYFILYTIVGTFHLLVDRAQLRLFNGQFSDDYTYYVVLVILLSIGFTANIFKDRLKGIRHDIWACLSK